MKITPKQKEQILDYPFLEDRKFEYVDDQDLYIDNHGCLVKLCVIKDRAGNLYGFLYERNSEETFYDTDNRLFELEAKEVVKIEYTRKDGQSFYE